MANFFTILEHHHAAWFARELLKRQNQWNCWNLKQRSNILLRVKILLAQPHLCLSMNPAWLVIGLSSYILSWISRIEKKSQICPASWFLHIFAYFFFEIGCTVSLLHICSLFQCIDFTNKLWYLIMLDSIWRVQQTNHLPRFNSVKFLNCRDNLGNGL